MKTTPSPTPARTKARMAMVKKKNLNLILSIERTLNTKNQATSRVSLAPSATHLRPILRTKTSLRKSPKTRMQRMATN
jgi:hypothetical protein